VTEVEVTPREEVMKSTITSRHLPTLNDAPCRPILKANKRVRGLGWFSINPRPRGACQLSPSLGFYCQHTVR